MTTGTNRDIVASARRYVQAWRAVSEAGSGNLLSAVVERDHAFHDLIGMLGETCPMCDEGSCPYTADVEEVAEWVGDGRIDDAADPGGLLNDPSA
jgi:hypothetical protein